MNRLIGYKINDVVSFEEIFPLYEAVGWTNYTSNPNNATKCIRT